MNLKICLICILFLYVGFRVSGQTFGSYIKYGDKASEGGDWGAALYAYQSALQMREAPTARLKAIRAAMAFHSYDLALEWAEALYASSEVDLEPYRGEAALRAAEAWRAKGQYDKAIQWLEKSARPDASALIEQCRWALERMADSAAVVISHPGPEINSEFSDFGPFLSGDTLYFSSYRFKFRDDDHDPPRRLTQTMMHLPGRRRPTTVRQGLNADDKHTAHLAFSEDRSRQYFARCTFSTSVSIRCDLYERTKRDSRRWYPAKPLREGINNAGWSTTQPASGTELATGRELLFFGSNRPGGAGGYDIWYCTRDSQGIFSDPTPLPFFNTPSDEVTPFFDTHSQTLYFSSEGHPGMGGFDIYAISWPPKDTVATHLPYPLNGSYNDLDYTPVDSLFAYFASNRPGSFYLNEDNKTCCNDIYTASFSPPQPDTLAPSTPLVTDSLARLTPPDTLLAKSSEPSTLEDFLPLRLYFDNDQPDPRSRKTTTRLTYPETFEAYYSKKPVFLDSLASAYPPGESMAVRQAEAFFEDEVKRGNTLLSAFSEILYSRLEGGETIEIFIKGFTSPRAQSAYNRTLGERRVASLINHFTTWKNGALAPFLASGQLTLSRRSFGEEQAAPTVSDALSDRTGSIYSTPASRERRVEIVEIIRQ